MRKLRRSLTPFQQQQASTSVTLQLMAQPRILSSKHIALYLSFDGEIDTRSIIEQLWLQGKTVYLPVLHPFNQGHLLFIHHTSEQHLVTNRFGLTEPKLDVRRVIPFSHLDTIIVPLVVFDTRGHRIGMGGGYYDRTLRHWHEQGVYPLGLAHDCQQVALIHTQHWDLPLPEIITPSRHWIWDNYPPNREPKF